MIFLRGFSSPSIPCCAFPSIKKPYTRECIPWDIHPYENRYIDKNWHKSHEMRLFMPKKSRHIPCSLPCPRELFDGMTFLHKAKKTVVSPPLWGRAAYRHFVFFFVILSYKYGLFNEARKGESIQSQREIFFCKV